MLAMAIFGLVATSIIGLLGTSLNYAQKARSSVLTTFAMKNQFFEPAVLEKLQKNPKQELTQKDETHELRIIVQESPALKKYAHCFIMDVTLLNADVPSLAAIAYVEPEEKEKS